MSPPNLEISESNLEGVAICDWLPRFLHFATLQSK